MLENVVIDGALAPPPALALRDACDYLHAERRDRGGGLLQLDLSPRRALDWLTAG
ncbi:hypothetical protein [Xanthomonas theicola]|nr:hypothetical protein [Xanthomonas theicola]QNH26119.1 hypothetical protein G4Q83_17105 [Xanthomonas theicola]